MGVFTFEGLELVSDFKEGFTLLERPGSKESWVFRFQIEIKKSSLFIVSAKNTYNQVSQILI